MFYQIRAIKWAEHAAELGVTPEMIAELESDVAAAKAAMLRQHQAQAAAQAATLGLKNAMEKLSKDGACLMLQIRAAARRQGREIYPLAMVPLPEKGSPIRELGKPTDFEAKLVGMGWIELSWKCTNPPGCQGTTYHIERQLDGKGAFTYLATVGKKKFIDRSIPRPTASIAYRISAIRSTGRGKPATHYVSFGNEASGALLNMHNIGGPPVLAAA